MLSRIPTALAVLLLIMLASDREAHAEDSTVLFEGTWTDKGYAIAGAWSIVEEGGRRFLLLDEEFRTQRAPDLKIFLSPLSLDEINSDNATDGSLLISPLEKHRGAQRYEIETDVDVSEYATILIHCERFSKLWGGARLR